MVIVLLAVVEHCLYTFPHASPPLPNRLLLAEHIIHKSILLEGVEAEDVEVDWDKGRHLPRVPLQKHPKSPHHLLASQLIKVEDVKHTVVYFGGGKLGVGAFLDAVGAGNEGEEDAIDEKAAGMAVKGEGFSE